LTPQVELQPKFLINLTLYHPHKLKINVILVFYFFILDFYLLKSDNAKNQRTNLTPSILSPPVYVVGQACLMARQGKARQGRVGVGKNR
jgi:hypothetical protein